MKKPKWCPKFIPPVSEQMQAGWFYVHELDGSLGMRKYDGTTNSWYAYSNASDVQTLVPNESFKEWLFIDGLR